MQAEIRDRIVRCVEEQFEKIGASSYDEAFQKAQRAIAKLQESMEKIGTRSQFMAQLDAMPNCTKTEFALIGGTLKLFPQLLHYALKFAALRAADTLPAIPLGRPQLDIRKRAQIVALVGQKFTMGSSLEQSKKFAAKKLDVSEASVQRAWDDRKSIDDADFHSVLAFWAEESGVK